MQQHSRRFGWERIHGYTSRHMKYLCAALCLAAALAGCKSNTPATGQRLERRGDEIVVAGQLFHTGTPVVLWTDPGGYDAYRTERRFSPIERASFAWSKAENPELLPNRFGWRSSVLSDAELDQIRGGGWTLDLLQDRVDQFVVHYDACGVSQSCFQMLHDSRGLSVHFMLDIDGTIYQTLDLKERAWHAGKANSRSIGIEIANLGTSDPATLSQWYAKQPDGRMKITIPAHLGDGGLRVPGDYYSARDGLIRGVVNGKTYEMYDFTPQQYDALTRLVAIVCTVLPKVTLDFPKDGEGKLVAGELTQEMYANYTGLLGHYNVTQAKQDPGPAFQWDLVIDGARKLMSKEALKKNAAMKGRAVPQQQNRLTDAPKAPEPVASPANPANPGDPSTGSAPRP